MGYALALAGTTAIFMAVLNAPVHFPACLTYLGRISFGLYVFHTFFLMGLSHAFTDFSFLHPVLAFSINLALTVACAAASYRFFERPVLRLKRHFEIIRTTAP